MTSVFEEGKNKSVSGELWAGGGVDGIGGASEVGGGGGRCGIGGGGSVSGIAGGTDDMGGTGGGGGSCGIFGVGAGGASLRMFDDCRPRTGLS